jgi:hypothetical protein
VDTIKNNLRHIKSNDFISDTEEVEKSGEAVEKFVLLKVREAAGSASHE